MKFNHNKKNKLKAIGCNTKIDVINLRLSQILEKFISDESMHTQSQLSELIDNAFERDVILYLATEGIVDKLISDKYQTIIREYIEKKE